MPFISLGRTDSAWRDAALPKPPAASDPLSLPCIYLDNFKIPVVMSYLVFSHQAWAEVSGAMVQPEGRFMVLLSTPDSQRLWSHSREETIAQQGGPPAESKPSTWSHLCPHRHPTPAPWLDRAGGTEIGMPWKSSTIRSHCLETHHLLTQGCCSRLNPLSSHISEMLNHYSNVWKIQHSSLELQKSR